jgi:hypothetical protein
MKNAFDPQGNFSEWIQNDWESDDYIEHQKPQRNYRNSAPQEKTEAKYWILAILLYIVKSPLFWIAILVIGFVKG